MYVDVLILQITYIHIIYACYCLILSAASVTVALLLPHVC